jgi:hypothetical protein
MRAKLVGRGAGRSSDFCSYCTAGTKPTEVSLGAGRCDPVAIVSVGSDACDTGKNDAVSIVIGVLVALGAVALIAQLWRARSRSTVRSVDSQHARRTHQAAPAQAHIEFVEEQPNSVAMSDDVEIVLELNRPRRKLGSVECPTIMQLHRPQNQAQYMDREKIFRRT